MGDRNFSWIKNNYWVFILLMALLSLGLADLRKNRIWSDAEGYYMYLPAVFIYGGFYNDIPVNTTDQFLINPETGMYLNKYTYGVSVLEAPFFLAAHLITSNGWFHSSNPNGYSKSYNDAILAAALFYTMWGLWLVFLALQRYFSKPIAMLTPALLYFGTNLWFYTVQQSGMSHAYSFFLFAVIVWLTPRFLEKPTHGRMILMATVMGLITVIRPVNLMLALYPLLFEVGSKEDFQRRLRFIWDQRNKWLWIPLMFFLVLLPQMYYWNIQYGHWLYYSYEGEGFTHWRSPYIISLLFSRWNGMIIYSPLMAIPLLGLLWLAFKRKMSGPGTLVLMLIFLWVNGSWHMWRFGGAFGYRPVIEFMAVLAFPLAYVLRASQQWHLILRLLFWALLATFVWYTTRMGMAYFGSWSEDAWSWWHWWEAVKTGKNPY